MRQHDYYQILGVSSSATEQEIKRAYREMARRYHPDLNPDDDEAENQFKRINEAYAVLSDADKRARYDRFGSAWQQSGQAAGADWRRTQNRSSATRQRNATSNGLFSDLWNSLFGDSGVRSRSEAERNKTPIRGFDIDIQTTISLEEAYTGTICKINKPNGQEFNAQIPAGARTGTKVRFAGQGKRGFAGGEPGDLYVVVTVDEHDVFVRDGDDLHVELRIGLYTAVLGGDTRIPTMTGEVKLKIPPGTQSGQRIRLLGKGMPRIKNPKEFGDLFVRPLIQIPTKLSDTELELFQHLRSLR